jgi:RNA polymerase sigma-70 factor, ECF subfamily
MTVGTGADDRTCQPVAASQAWAALAGLGPQARQVIVEMYFHGRSVTETAEKMGIPAAAVISYSYYGLRRLRDAMACGPLPESPAEITRPG